MSGRGLLGGALDLLAGAAPGSGWHLERPWVLAALALVPLYAWLRLRSARRETVAFAPLQFFRGSAASTVRTILARALLPLEIALVAVLIVALAGPYRGSRLDLYQDEGIDLALVLDVSLSMLADDFAPTRLDATRRLAGELIDRRPADRIGVFIFARDAYVQSPLTTDHRALRELLAGATVHTIDQARSGGTAVGDALLVAGGQLAASRIEGRDQALVLITDGESNLGIDPVLAARWLAERGVRLYAIGVGGEEPVAVLFEGRPVGDGLLSALDESQLRAVADAAEGRFYRALDEDALGAVFGELSRLASAPLEAVTVERRTYATAPLARLALLLFVGYAGLAAGLLRRPLR